MKRKKCIERIFSGGENMYEKNVNCMWTGDY